MSRCHDELAQLEGRSKSRIHLTRWAVTALAENHRRRERRGGMAEAQRAHVAGNSNFIPWRDVYHE
jgi:hypothetical protein